VEEEVVAGPHLEVEAAVAVAAVVVVDTCMASALDLVVAERPLFQAVVVVLVTVV
jgi:hypothetical protein